MKRVLLVIHSQLSIGGAQNVLMTIVRNLHKEYRFDILCFSDKKGEYDEEFLSYGGKIHRIPLYNGDSRFRQRLDFYIRGNHIYREAAEIFKQNEYDIIHCHNGFESGIIFAAARKADVKIRLVHVHTSSGFRGNAIRKAYIGLLERKIHKTATSLIACSKEAGKAWFPKNENIKVIYNSHNDKVFDMGLYKQEKLQNIRLIQVGRFSPEKNQEFSLRILAEILKTKPDTTLTLVGGIGDAEENRLKSISEKLGVARNVNFIPATDKIAEILNEQNVFLFPSLREGFGIAIIEAQGMGLKCFASDTVPKATDCGGVEFLSLESGAAAWAEKIIADFEKTGGIHIKYDCSSFSEENVMNKYRELYEGK